ncbi:box C/D snoRNA protein 1-like [Coccinella septempunctata]|uniref:box C/D snoRNA protein 1-like n=1 Tax=Coccinella septempunctata TaxID=41139 RepID=UPI001D08B613|nr:box C/D snoRNA protein 1-like [Coccinella septempunctata]
MDSLSMSRSMSEQSEELLNTSRLGNCDVCNTSRAKYVCPRCECKTCCLECNKIHKKELECTGERDKTKYVPLKNENRNTNLVLLSDYRLLEEVTRKTENFHKAAKPYYYRSRNKLKKLELAAMARSIKLKFYPPVFERNKNNTTSFDYKQNLIYWHMDCFFVNAENLKFSSEQVSEMEKLSSVIEKHLSTNDEALSKKLLIYQAAGHSGIKILLRAENKAGSKFYEVNLSDTLRECLKNKSIIEYPIFYIILADHKYGFDVIDSEGDETVGNSNSNRAPNLCQTTSHHWLGLG